MVHEFPIARVQSYRSHSRTRKIPERRNRAAPRDYISAQGGRPVQAAEQRGHRGVQTTVLRAGSVTVRFLRHGGVHPVGHSDCASLSMKGKYSLEDIRPRVVLIPSKSLSLLHRNTFSKPTRSAQYASTPSSLASSNVPSVRICRSASSSVEMAGHGLPTGIGGIRSLLDCHPSFRKRRAASASDS